MFEAMAYEVAPFGVEVCIIQPGGYPTKIWENGGRLLDGLLKRTDQDLTSAYADHLQLAQGLNSTPRTTDPMDIPRAIGEIIAMPAGSRPLRRPVHPNTQGVDAANAALAQIQASALSNGPYKDWHAAVTD